MPGSWMRAAAAGLMAGALGLLFTSAGAAEPSAPAYTADGKLVFPADYRDWIFLSAGIDMAYVEGADPSHHMFDNVFASRDAVASFRQTGHWPDKTVLVLEQREGVQDGSINKRGRFQTGRMGFEVHVRDAARGGWAFFAFDGEGPGRLLPRTQACYACHQDHGAVDTTFVQFYPTLAPTARAKGTYQER